MRKQLRHTGADLAAQYVEQIEEWQHPSGLCAKRQFPQLFFGNGDANPHHHMLRGNLGKTWTFGAKAKEDSGAWSKELVKFTCTREMRRALQASDEAVEGIRSVGIRLDASHADCTILRAELKTRMQDFINSEDSGRW